MLPNTVKSFRKRFTRNELRATGKKLTFIDVNVLSRLFSSSNIKEEDIISKFSGIIPVLSSELLAELVNGLKTEAREYDVHVRKTLTIMSVLQKCQAVYVLDHQIIKVFEYLSILKGKKPYEVL